MRRNVDNLFNELSPGAAQNPEFESYDRHRIWGAADIIKLYGINIMESFRTAAAPSLNYIPYCRRKTGNPHSWKWAYYQSTALMVAPRRNLSRAEGSIFSF